MPAALVLSGPFGLGHAASAQAVTGCLQAAGWQAGELDSLRLLGPRAGAAGERVFRALLAHPVLYDALHFSHLRTASALAGAMDYLGTRGTVRALRAALEPAPVELLLSVFATGASAAGRLPPALAGTRVAMCVDATVHRLWLHPGTDLFLVTSPAAEASVRRLLPDARVAVLPAPVRPAFRAAPDRAAARAALAIPAGEPCALLVGGGWGLGPLAATADALGRRGVQVLAVAGTNTDLADRLEQVAARNPRVHAFGHTARMAELMAAADLVVTAPGASTCAEARALGRFLVLLDVVAGHGRDNLQHELARGGAAVCDGHPDRAAATVRSWLARRVDPAPGPADFFGPALWQALGAVGIRPEPAGGDV